MGLALSILCVIYWFYPKTDEDQKACCSVLLLLAVGIGGYLFYSAHAIAVNWCAGLTATGVVAWKVGRYVSRRTHQKRLEDERREGERNRQAAIDRLGQAVRTGNQVALTNACESLARWNCLGGCTADSAGGACR